MSEESRNVEILKDAYRRWSESKGGSVEDWFEVCADKIAFGSLAQGRAASVNYMTSYASRDELMDYFAGLARDWEMIEWKTKDFIAQGDRVVALVDCTWKFKKTGKVVSTPKADVWRLKDGKAVEYFEYYDTAQVHAAVA